jgi:hypothetical protein
MSRQATFTRCQTLRLDQPLDDLLTTAAFEGRMSKASYVRAAIRQSLGVVKQSPTRLKRNELIHKGQEQGGAR